MVDRIISEIAKAFPLSERPVDEYCTAKVSGLTFTLRSYDAKGLGVVSVMKGKGMFGLMDMDTVVINPFEVDAPLFSYDRIHAMGNDTILLEMFDTCLEKTGSYEGFDAVIKAFSDLHSEEAKKCWYDSIKLPQSLKMKGKKGETPRFDELTLKYFEQYLELLKTAPSCDRALKIKKASAYTEGLLSNGGASTDAFLKKKGRDWTSRMFRDHMFGTGDPS